MMNKQLRKVTKDDLLSLEQYSLERKKLRKNLIEFKKHRRVQLGPYATFYFECYETMLAQIQEMLYIEKGGDEQLKDELSAYNPLIPNGKELTATLMFEIDNPISRADFLGKIGGIEKKVYMQVAGEYIQAISETDVDRTSAEGKASPCPAEVTIGIFKFFAILTTSLSPFVFFIPAPAIITGFDDSFKR